MKVITDKAPVCKIAGVEVEIRYPHIFFDSLCRSYTKSYSQKYLCAKNIKPNEVLYEECTWITKSTRDVVIRNFIMNQSMRLSMFNHHLSLKMLAILKQCLLWLLLCCEGSKS